MGTKELHHPKMEKLGFWKKKSPLFDSSIFYCSNISNGIGHKL